MEDLAHIAEIYTRKKCHYQILFLYVIKQRGSIVVGILYLGKQIHNIVGLPEVVLYVVVLCLVAEFLKLILECAALLEEAMHFTCDVHTSLSLSFITLSIYALTTATSNTMAIDAIVATTAAMMSIVLILFGVKSCFDEVR